MILSGFDLFARVMITLVMVLAIGVFYRIWQSAELRQSDRTYTLAAVGSLSVLTAGFAAILTLGCAWVAI